ncbi:MAG: thiamine pyrophosphate-binding protein [Oscillospiraceae bacterium]|jgi:acetolactate synthase-1/2/3 large subunit|nr:thiamine pyrophosphate-binding protein [Oscillospiraceae bacterium]
MKLTGAEILAEELINQGAEVIFGYPGAAVSDIWNAIARDSRTRLIMTSREDGAAHAADGYARASGKTGVVIATSGPGATNLVTGIAAAHADSQPVIAVTGNVGFDLIGRDSFQEADIVSITNPITKHNYLVRSADELALIVREAFTIANSGRKGPVLIDIPKDVQLRSAQYAPLPKFTPRTPPEPASDLIGQVLQLIAAADRPLILSGGGVTFGDASVELRAFAESRGIPVAVTMPGLGSIPVTHPLYLGMTGVYGTERANAALRDADLIIAVGVRFSDRLALTSFPPIIHIDIDRSELGKNTTPVLAVHSDAKTALRLLGGIPANAERVLPAQRTILLVTDVGNHQISAVTQFPFEHPRQLISSCGLGAMGFGMGAAVGAAIACPQSRTLLVTGDGSFHMNLAELATAVSLRLPITVVVVNNQSLGMLNMPFCRATDFVAAAKAFGAEGFTVSRRGELDAAISKTFSLNAVCVIEYQCGGQTYGDN